MEMCPRIVDSGTEKRDDKAAVAPDLPLQKEAIFLQGGTRFTIRCIGWMLLGNLGCQAPAGNETLAIGLPDGKLKRNEGGQESTCCRYQHRSLTARKEVLA